MNGLPINTMWDVWANTVGKFPRKTAAIWQDRRYSYAEIDAAAANLASRLAREFGLKKGDRLAILAPNGIEFYTTYWAAMRLGVALVPINSRLRPDIMAFICNETGARALVVHKDFAASLEQFRGKLESVEKFLAIDFYVDEGIVHQFSNFEIFK